MNPTLITQYRCSECGELYKWEDEAIDCCASEEIEVPCWKCAECGEVYGDKDHARYCCLDEEIILPVSQEQLEAAGQERLAL